MLLAHFANHYAEFIDLYRSGVISRATANDWCGQIWNYIYFAYYSNAKAA
jgi:hypothetical protein